MKIDISAKAIVLALVDQFGFDPIDAGGLDESWRQQPGSPVYCQDDDAAGLRRAVAWHLTRSGKLRAAGLIYRPCALSLA